MRHGWLGILILAAFASPIFAKTKVDVASFANKASAGPCNAVEPWRAGIEEAFRHQLINSLNSEGFNVVEPELLRGERRDMALGTGVSNVHTKSTFKASQYSIDAVLKTFDICAKDSTVAVEVRVTDVKAGAVAQTFVSVGKAGNSGPGARTDYRGSSFNTGVFKDSPIGQATGKVIRDITARLKKAYPNRDVASEDYKIRTIPRSRSR